MKGRLVSTLVWSAALVLFLFYLKLITADPQIDFLLDAGVQFIVIFLAFVLGSWEKESDEKKKAKRSEKFTLGLIWHELRQNQNVLKQIDNNFKFAVSEEHMGWLASKMQFLKSLTEKIDTDAYVASQSSGAISEIKSDDVFNAITIAFENCRFLQTNFLITAFDFAMKYNVFTDPKTKTRLSEKTRADLVKLASEKLVGSKSELNAAIITVDEALKAVDGRLDHLGVKAELIERPTK